MPGRWIVGLPPPPRADVAVVEPPRVGALHVVPVPAVWAVALSGQHDLEVVVHPVGHQVAEEELGLPIAEAGLRHPCLAIAVFLGVE